MENQERYELEQSPLGRIVITEAQVDLIKNTVARGATNDELKLFFYECRRRGVHPLDRLIHFVKRGQGDDAKAVFQAGIDFLRSQAEETGQYRGQDSPVFGPALNGTNFPESATATVRRKDPETGEIYPVTATAYWDEYYPGEGKMGFMWRKMPRGQLAKCAEALALRKAFPKKIAGLYTFEEMEQADIIEQPGRPRPQPKPEVSTPQRKSTPTASQQPAPKAPASKELQDKLLSSLGTVVELQGRLPEEVLADLSSFTDKNGEVHSCPSVEELFKSEKWTQSVYGKLKKVLTETALEPGAGE